MKVTSNLFTEMIWAVQDTLYVLYIAYILYLLRSIKR